MFKLALLISVISLLPNSAAAIGPSVPLYGNWCGPNHPSNPLNAAAPINEIDAACQQHDLAYARGYQAYGDYQLVNHLSDIQRRQHQWIARQNNGINVQIQPGISLGMIDQAALAFMLETIRWQRIGRDGVNWMSLGFFRP
ncbi:MAG: hypothetical protein Q9N68_03395 [Gammaproteobacteria bacterium]|nr:hypothetical protein [Gammaproteobacteria bacterium]